MTNTSVINLGCARFLCDLINGAQIDIYAHIFQILGKTESRSTARTCLPFCSLIMKILLLKGLHPPKNGIVLPCQGLNSIHSLQSNIVHSSVEKAKKNVSRAPKNESKTLTLFAPTSKCSSAPNFSQQPEAKAPSPRPLEPKPSQTPPSQSSIPQLN